MPAVRAASDEAIGVDGVGVGVGCDCILAARLDRRVRETGEVLLHASAATGSQ